MIKIYFFLLTNFLFALISNGQNNKTQLQIGGKLINEFTFYDGIAPGVGGQVVYKRGKHGGIESGLYFQSRYQNFLTVIQTGQVYNYYNAKIAERWLQIPILYRFDSKFINFVAGPQVDYFIGWKQKFSTGGSTITDYDRSSVRITATAGISKSFNLSPSLIIEPEAKFNYLFSESNGGIQLNVAIRKRIK